MKLSAHTTIQDTQSTIATSDEIVYFRDKRRRATTQFSKGRLGTTHCEISERLKSNQLLATGPHQSWASSLNTNQLHHQPREFQIISPSKTSHDTCEIGDVERDTFCAVVLTLSASSCAVGNDRQNGSQWNMQCNAG